MCYLLTAGSLEKENCVLLVLCGMRLVIYPQTPTSSAAWVLKITHVLNSETIYLFSTKSSSMPSQSYKYLTHPPQSRCVVPQASVDCLPHIVRTKSNPVGAILHDERVQRPLPILIPWETVLICFLSSSQSKHLNRVGAGQSAQKNKTPTS